MDYTKLKQAMHEVGYLVTEGPEWNAVDAALFRQFSQFQLGIPFDHADRIFEYPANYATILGRNIELFATHDTLADASIVVDIPESETTTTVEIQTEPSSDTPENSISAAPVEASNEEPTEEPTEEQSNAGMEFDVTAKE